MASSIKVGDKVTTTAEYSTNGIHLAPAVRSTTYTVMSISGTSAVIGLNGVVTARVAINSLTKQGGSKSTNKNKDNSKGG